MSTRREFITLVGGAAVAWPLTVLAQQAVMPIIGFLSSRSPAESTAVVAAFRQGLREAGFVEGTESRNRVPLGGRSLRRAARARCRSCKLACGCIACGRRPALGRMPPKRRPRPFRLCSQQRAIRSASGSSPASTGRRETLQA